MRCVVYRGAYNVAVEDGFPRPTLQEPRDAIVRVTRTAICGSDLHPYRGHISKFPSGCVMGHEFVGIVEEIAEEVEDITVGRRVLASDIVACGRCWYCQRGMHYQCPDVSLFGYGEIVGRYVAGGQAEFVRVPNADVVLCHIPEVVPDEQALFVTDALATGYACAERGEVTPGDSVAVVGCGPVGLCALLAAKVRGAGQILAIDPDPRRRQFAQRLGARPCAPDDSLANQVRDGTHERGADVVLEAVGSDEALAVALSIVRPRGTISVVGAHHSQAMPFPTEFAFARELTVRFSVGNPISTRERLLQLLLAGRLDPSILITHRLPLSEARDGYQLFHAREALKVVLDPAA